MLLSIRQPLTRPAARRRRALSTGVLALVSLSVALSATTGWGQELRAPIRDPQLIFQKRNRSWTEIRRQNIVMQAYDYSCGAATLATLLRFYWGDNVNEPAVLHVIDGFLTSDELRDRAKNGLSMADLKRAAVDMGYQSEVGTVKLSELAQSKVPLIVGITANNYNHFVVVRGVIQGNVYLADPMRGNIRLTVPVFSSQWQKNAVLVVLKPNVDPPKISPLTVRVNEADLGELNNQVIRTTPPRPFSLPAP